MSVLKSRKARALLAGGVVLGVGASMTLAAWSDSEWASGTFGTSGFVFQGSINETDFADHASEGGAAVLAFEQEALNLEPGDSVSASFWLKVNKGPDATVTLQNPKIGTSDTLADQLDAEVKLGDCSTGTVIKTGKLNAMTGGGAVGTVGADAVQTCFTITLPSTYTGTADATTGAVNWEFKAATV